MIYVLIFSDVFQKKMEQLIKSFPSYALSMIGRTQCSKLPIRGVHWERKFIGGFTLVYFASILIETQAVQETSGETQPLHNACLSLIDLNSR